MLFDRSNWPQHRPWLIASIGVTAGATAWFWKESEPLAEWAGGNTLAGFTFGVAGGLIILFEWLWWLRKKVRAWRVGSAQTWMRAHIWLGLLCLPLAILHSGLRLGGTLSTVLMLLLIAVIASGIGGLILQNLIPRRLLAQAPAETMFVPLEYLVGQLQRDADRLVSAATGIVIESPRMNDGPDLVGMKRPVELLMPTAPITNSEPLLAFYREQVIPYLHVGAAESSPLVNSSRAAVLFHNCKTQLPDAAHNIVNALESLCQQRRDWDRQVRWRFWLNAWLWVHVPLSVALVLLLTAHVMTALKYW